MFFGLMAIDGKRAIISSSAWSPMPRDTRVILTFAIGIFKNNQAQVDEYLAVLNPLLRRTTEGNCELLTLDEWLEKHPCPDSVSDDFLCFYFRIRVAKVTYDDRIELPLPCLLFIRCPFSRRLALSKKSPSPRTSRKVTEKGTLQERIALSCFFFATGLHDIEALPFRRSACA